MNTTVLAARNAQKEKVEHIEKELSNLGANYKWVLQDFTSVIEHPTIQSHLDKAYKETRTSFINRHGRMHGLIVVANVIELFKLIHFDDLESDYLGQNLQALNTKEELLFTLLVSAYIHDVGRFYDPEIDRHPQNISLAIDKLAGMLHNDTICRAQHISCSHADILERIKELCMCHDNKTTPSNAVEIAMVKIADALDCDQHRIFPEDEIPELQTVQDKFVRFKRIIFKDDHPEDRFACSAITSVALSYQPDEGVIDTIINTPDLRASAKPLKTLITCLQLCRRGTSDSTKDLASRIRIFVQTSIEDQQTPALFLLFPEQIQDIKTTIQTHIVKSTIDLRIQDMKGTTELTNYSLHTVKAKKGIQSMPTWLEGYTKADWHKELQVQAFIKIDQNWKEVNTVHKYAERGGIAHWWKISFQEKGSTDSLTFKEGESIEIREIIIWPGCTNVSSDEFYYRPVHPCKRIEICIYFPSNVNAKQITAWLEVRRDSEIIWKDPTRLRIQLDKCTQVCKVKGSFDELKPGYDYSLKWSIK